MVPDVGISKPANIMSKVLLPQPLGPMTTRNSPWLTVRLTLSRATTSRGVSAPHTLVMSVQMISPTLVPPHSALHTLQLRSALPPQDTSLHQATAGIEEIAHQADHGHTQECQVHVHHLSSYHHDGSQSRPHPDHFRRQHAHPGAEEIDPHDNEELREDGGKDHMLNHLAPTRTQDASGVDIDL